MRNFPDYIRDRLERNGYDFIRQFANLDLFMRSPDGKPIWICYLEVEIDPEQIRRMFEFTGHVLIVIKESLIPQEIVSRKETPQWLRVLHGLYLGRVYVWNDRFLFGLHFDYETGDISESGIIQPDELLLIETGTWLRGWADQYKLARFYDKAWWTEAGDSGYQSSGYQDYWQKRQGNKQSYGYYGGTGGQKQEYDTPWAKQPQQETGRDFAKEFRACNDLMAVKALYRKLAQQYHPDISGYDSTAEMAAINSAYDRARQIYA